MLGVVIWSCDTVRALNVNTAGKQAYTKGKASHGLKEIDVYNIFFYIYIYREKALYRCAL